MRLFLLLPLIFYSFLNAKNNESLKYISAYGISKSSDIPFNQGGDPRNSINPSSLKPGDVICMESYYVPIFYRDCLPKIETPVVLVFHGGDESFPTSHQNEIDIEDLIGNQNILHIFAQNCDYTGPQMDKVSPLPIGINIHTLITGSGAFGEKQESPQKQEALLTKIVANLRPTNKRKKKALIDFHLNDTICHGWPTINRYLDPGETRQTIKEKLAGSKVVDIMTGRIRRREFWKLKGTYAFSISPPGNGLDTHRTWEDLILGCIVIVKSSPMDRLYEGLPVVIINDWSEINEENIDKWLKQYGNVLDNPNYRERITLKYWVAKFRSPTLMANHPIIN